MESIKLENGKYELALKKNGSSFECRRYGEEWQSLNGNKMVLALFYRIQELEESKSGLFTKEEKRFLNGQMVLCVKKCLETMSKYEPNDEYLAGVEDVIDIANRINNKLGFEKINLMLEKRPTIEQKMEQLKEYRPSIRYIERYDGWSCTLRRDNNNSLSVRGMDSAREAIDLAEKLFLDENVTGVIYRKHIKKKSISK